MTDREKINAIRAEVQNYIDAARKAHANITEGNFAHLLSFIDSLPEEPVSIWHGMDDPPIKGEVIVVQTKDTFYGVSIQKGGTTYKNRNKDRYVKWAYASDLLNLSNVQRNGKNRKEEPVSEELEKEIGRAHRIFYDEVGWDSDEGARAYVADWFAHYFANWQKHHMEANRLAHCNSITNEQAELEQKFLDEHLNKHDRMPTSLDAIEYGMAKEKENIKKSPYLRGYVARDKNGLLHVFEVEPRRLEDYWWDRDYRSEPIVNGDFPDLKWEDEPIYVRLLIVKSES